MSTNQMRRDLGRLISRRNLAVGSIKTEKEALEAAGKKVVDTEAARRILQETAEKMQNKAHKQVAKVVSRCLYAVFEEPYELKIQFEQKRGKTEAEFVYIRNGNEVQPLVTSGGVLSVVGLALRLASLMMNMPPARKLLILDEPLAGLSKTNLEKMGVLLETLSRELDMQIIIATHDPALHIGRIIEI